MVESTALEMRHTGNCIGGSNPSLSASSYREEYSLTRWQLQYAVIVFQFCRPVWERFVRLAALSGAIDARGFDRDPAPWLAVEWLPPKWDWFDPLKDARRDRTGKAKRRYAYAT